MALVLTDIGVGTTEGDDTGDKARVGGLAINANNALIETAVEFLQGRFWTIRNTSLNPLVMGARYLANNHAGITFTLPATFATSATDFSDVWVANADDVSNVILVPASGDAFYVSGVTLGVDTTYALTPGNTAILSPRTTDSEWDLVLFIGGVETELSTLGAVIKTAYEGEANTNAFTDANVTAIEALQGRNWTIRNTTLNPLVMGARYMANNHASITFTLPAVFSVSATDFSDVWVCNADDASNVTLIPASGDAFFVNGTTHGVDTNYAVIPGAIVILSPRTTDSEWDLVVYDGGIKLSALPALAVEMDDTDEIYVNNGGESNRQLYSVFKAAFARLDTAQEYTKTQNFNQTALTSTTNSIAWDLANNQVAGHTATENTTLANPTNKVAGATYIFVWTQHASAPKTLAFDTEYLFPGGNTPIVTATNGAVDIITFISDGTNMFGVISQDFS